MQGLPNWGSVLLPASGQLHFCLTYMLHISCWTVVDLGRLAVFLPGNGLGGVWQQGMDPLMKSSGQRHEYLVLTEFLLARIKPKANSSIVTSFIKCTKYPQEVSKCSLKKKRGCYWCSAAWRIAAARSLFSKKSAGHMWRSHRGDPRLCDGKNRRLAESLVKMFCFMCITK